MAKFWKWIKIIGLVFIILIKLMLLIPDEKKESNISENVQAPKLDVSKTDTGLNENWEWVDYYNHNCSVVFHVPYTDVRQGEHNRLYEIKELPMYPGEIDYSSLIISGGISFLDDLASQLNGIALVYRLDSRQLADVIVSMIQNIPYTLIHTMTHENAIKMAKENHVDFMVTYHEDPNNMPYNREWYGGCQESVEPAGVYTPAEFISTMKGDCDTRTLFLYSLMKKMGYDVAIVNGPGHSMLGCNLIPENPSAPYLENKVSRYYFWETTFFYNENGEMGPRLGDISDPDFNVNEWKIMLN